MQTDISSLNKLHILEALLQEGYKSDLLGKALNKLMKLELANLKRELQQLETRIKKLETKYDMNSESFAKKFHAGVVDDSADNMEWISFIDMRQAVLLRIQLLQGKNV